MGCKAAETTCNINNTFGPGTANECTLQWWVKKFCQGDESLKMRSAVASHWKLAVTDREDHCRQSSYNYTRSCRRTQCQPFFSCSAFEANWKGEKPQ